MYDNEDTFEPTRKDKENVINEFDENDDLEPQVLHN